MHNLHNFYMDCFPEIHIHYDKMNEYCSTVIILDICTIKDNLVVIVLQVLHSFKTFCAFSGYNY